MEMQEIAERITKVIKDKAKTKTEFAEKLNISQSFVSRLASGEKEPSDRTIADICREYDVNEDWLRTGRGDPYIQLSRDEELAQFFGEVMKGEDPDFRRRLLSVMSRLTTDEWALLEQMAWKLVDELRQDSGADHLIPRTNR
jgi:transcriptional regulator with XRE-family HTH domain